MDLTEFNYRTVADEKGCWLWQGNRNNQGYGFAYHDKKSRGAHRVSWMLNRGPIPEGQWVLHKCDNPPCVNPDHLFLGDRRDNMIDCLKKGRIKNGGTEINKKKTHCPKGHPYSEENTYVWKGKGKRTPMRECKACKKLRPRSVRLP